MPSKRHMSGESGRTPDGFGNEPDDREDPDDGGAQFPRPDAVLPREARDEAIVFLPTATTQIADEVNAMAAVLTQQQQTTLQQLLLLLRSLRGPLILLESEANFTRPLFPG
jgi:hypothetical protein